MANPKKPEHKKAQTTGVSLPPHILREAKKAAFARGLSLSGFMRDLLLRELQSN